MLRRGLAVFSLLIIIGALLPGMTAAGDWDDRDSRHSRYNPRQHVYARLCAQLERLHERYPRYVTVPAFCNDDDEQEEAPEIDFSADPTTIDVGESVTLEWDTDNADSCTASDGWSGSKDLSGEEGVSPATTTTYTLTCENDEGNTSVSETITVIPASNPIPTVSISVFPATIEVGATSTLSWNSTNTSTCTASAGWSGSQAVSGSQIVNPATTTVYVLSCVGAGGSTSATTTLTVTAEPEIPQLSLVANPSSIQQGDSTLLSWHSTSTNACTASGGWSGATSLSGSQSVSPTTTTAYALMCSGVGGTVYATATVTVTQAPIPTVSLNASPLSIQLGATSTLSWNSSNATSCTTSGGWSGGVSLSGSQGVSPATTTQYVIACTGVGGIAYATTTVTVTQVLVPTLTFSANPQSIIAGDDSDLTWNTTGATSCMASGGWSGSKAISGTQNVSPATTTQYVLACSGLGGTVHGTTTLIVTATSSPIIGHIVVSEVYYDVATTSGGDPTNEWVELYNGTNAAVNLDGWRIGDATSTSELPDGTIIQPGGFAVIVSNSTTTSFWSIPVESPVIVLGHTINSAGLSNTGDIVVFANPASSTIDAVSWGTNTSAFSPSAVDVPDGHSVARSSLTSDTNSAADWIDRATPTPGQ